MSNWFQNIFIEYLGVFLPAAGITLLITVTGIVIGLLLGFVFSLMKISNSKILQVLATVYISVIRGTPLLLQLLIVYFGLVSLISIPAFLAASVALGVHNGAYIAEIFRGAIQGVGKGQKEAGIALGMKKFQMMRRIVFPQAFKQAVPALGNQFIIALKDSSLASSIAVPELLLKARQLGSATFKTLEMLCIAGIFYLVLTSIFTVLVGIIEKNLRYKRKEA